MTIASQSLLRGGEWLLESAVSRPVFTPERLTDEQRLIGRTVTDFVTNEVLPVLDRLEQKDWTLSRDLVRRAGQLGLIGTDVAEAYGGDALDKVTSMIVSERMSKSASFAVTFGAQANLTVLPLSLFGTDTQKRQYLPRLLSGDAIGAYCLSESGAGSDALGARTKATRLPDGGFLLNGEKMWISNGGFADVFIVFAKVDGEHFTAFIVERAFPGVTSGKEEEKMGIHGSSTTPVIFQDVKVPAGNVLGEIGKAHKIAFNVLNFARLKLGAACGGNCREGVGEAARYARQRSQFGRPIASFGAIKHKLGEMSAQAYAVESLLYRTAGMIDARIGAAADDPDQSAALAAFEEYAAEASIAKVFSSEVLNFIFDENIQIHGGNGYVRDYPAERHYRDSRVNRIFEGTNEINRILIPSLLARRAAKGNLAIAAAARTAVQTLAARPDALAGLDAPPLLDAGQSVAAFKKATLAVFGLAMETYREGLTDQQEVLMHVADMMIDVYSCESAVLRAAQSVESNHREAGLHVAAARLLVNDAAMRIETCGRDAVASMLEGEALKGAAQGLHRLLDAAPINTVALRRQIADATVARGAYPF